MKWLEPHDDGLDFFRGLIVGGLVSAGLWVVIIATVRRVMS